LKKALHTLFDIKDNVDLLLLIEVGDFSISLVWSTFQRKNIIGIEVFNIDEQEDYTTFFMGVVNEIKRFNNQIKKTKVRYNSKESLLVPVTYYNASLNKEMLDLLYGENDFMIIKSDEVKEVGFYNIYRIPKPLDVLLTNHFSAIEEKHSTSKQIKLDVIGDQLFCIISHKRIKVFLYKGNNLQIVQQFNYQSFEDVIYHLLNICEQHSMNPSEIKLQLKGLIVKDSKLFQELHNYFLDIDFASTNDTSSLPTSISEENKHFLSHLIELALCE